MTFVPTLKGEINLPWLLGDSYFCNQLIQVEIFCLPRTQFSISLSTCKITENQR